MIQSSSAYPQGETLKLNDESNPTLKKALQVPFHVFFIYKQMNIYKNTNIVKKRLVHVRGVWRSGAYAPADSKQGTLL